MMVHYRFDANSCRELLGFIREELAESIQLTIGSDGEKAIQWANKNIYDDLCSSYIIYAFFMLNSNLRDVNFR